MSKRQVRKQRSSRKLKTSRGKRVGNLRYRAIFKSERKLPSDLTDPNPEDGYMIDLLTNFVANDLYDFLVSGESMTVTHNDSTMTVVPPPSMTFTLQFCSSEGEKKELTVSLKDLHFMKQNPNQIRLK
jgi:hypothetical protein